MLRRQCGTALVQPARMITSKNSRNSPSGGSKKTGRIIGFPQIEQRPRAPRPLAQTDVNTKQVFGDYIDIYDIQRACRILADRYSLVFAAYNSDNRRSETHGEPLSH